MWVVLLRHNLCTQYLPFDCEPQTVFFRPVNYGLSQVRCNCSLSYTRCNVHMKVSTDKHVGLHGRLSSSFTQCAKSHDQRSSHYNVKCNRNRCMIFKFQPKYFDSVHIESSQKYLSALAEFPDQMLHSHGRLHLIVSTD